MTTLFPPVLESRAVAIPFSGSSQEDFFYTIEFFIPEIDGPIATESGEEGIKHIQVVLKYKATGNSAVNSNYSPDDMTLFIPTTISKYVEYDPAIHFCKLHIPYRLFKNKCPEKGMHYTAQIRFGANELWISGDPFTEERTNFDGYSNWRALQVSTVPSNFGEWSNIQNVYCYGDAKTALTYNLNDFVPELFYEYIPEDNDPLEQCKIVYNYNDINGSVMKSLVFDGVFQSDGSYTLRVKLPVAPVQPIYISLEAITVNGTVRGKTLKIAPISQKSGLIPEASQMSEFKEGVLRGEELGDGVIAKRIEIPTAYLTSLTDTVSIYRSNLFTFDTIKIKENIPLKGTTTIAFKDFSVEMGEDYQYIAILNPGPNAKQFVPIYDWGFDNSGYGRLMNLDSVFLADRNHQLRIQGNINISSFKRNTAEAFQSTIGSKYPFYSRSAETNYRSFQLSGVISINMDPTSSFLKNDQIDGLRWEDKNGSRLLILNRDLYGDFEYSLSRVRIGNKNPLRHKIVEYENEKEEPIRGPSMIYDEYYARDHQSKIAPIRSDGMVFMERKFRECVMEWLSNGEPKLFRSETEGNMIIMPSAISFSPLEKTGRIVYTVTMTLTEIAELNLENLLDYNLMPIEISTHTLKGFPVELHIGDIISSRDYSALINLYPEVKDNFKRFDGKQEDYEVINENNLQEALDSINDYAFLRGSPQLPIYEKLIFIPSSDFNIGHLSIDTVKDNGWIADHAFIEGVRYTPGSVPDSLTFECVNTLPKGLTLNKNTGLLSIAKGTSLDEKSPTKLTFKVFEVGKESEAIYFTILVGVFYKTLTLEYDSIVAKTTDDEIKCIPTVSGGVKFNEVSGNPNDVNYIFASENLPYGLSLDQNGVISGKIIGKQLEGGSITIAVEDALGQMVKAIIPFGQILYWPYINDMDYFNLGYVEVGKEIRPIDLIGATVGGSRNFEYKVHGAQDDITLLPGITIQSGYIKGTLTNIPSDYSKSFLIDLYDKSIDPSKVAATATITVSQLLQKFEFNDNSSNKVLSEIKSIDNEDGTISIGEILAPIDILNYQEGGVKIAFVTGGLPFYEYQYDEKGEQIAVPYYKFKGVNFYPDYSISTKGILSGRAVVGNDRREATIYAIDARGAMIPLNGEENSTLIYPISSKLALKKALNLEFPRSIEGDEDPAMSDYKIDFDIDEYLTGGYGEYKVAKDDENWPEWLDTKIENNKIVIFQKSNRTVNKGIICRIKISDNSKPYEQAIYVSLYIGEVVAKMEFIGSEPMEFIPPLQLGTFSVAHLPTISGGIPPYTFSTDGGLDNTEIKLYQGQGAEQDPNKFYIGGAPTNTDNISATIWVTDGIGQKIQLAFSSKGAVEELDFNILNSLNNNNLVKGLSNISGLQIIEGQNGFPFEDGSYKFSFNGQTGESQDFILGLNFNGETGQISGFPTEVKLKSSNYQKEFKVIDSSDNPKGFNDDKINHIWKSPIVYDQTMPTESIIIDELKEGESLVTPPLFKGGIGIAQHPDARYSYSFGNKFIELKDKDELIYTNESGIEISTGIFWDMATTTLQSLSINRFILTGSAEFTITIRVEIFKNENNYLEEDYNKENSLHFKGIKEAFIWKYSAFTKDIGSKNYSIEEVSILPENYTNNTLYITSTEAYFYKDSETGIELVGKVQRSSKLILDLPMQRVPANAGEQVWSADLNEIKETKLYAKIVGGFNNRLYEIDIPNISNWYISGSVISNHYTLDGGKPDVMVETIPVKITTFTINDANTSSSISLDIIWHGAMQELTFIRYPNLTEKYNLNNGLIRTIGDNLLANVIGGSGDSNNYKYEIKEYNSELDNNPYGTLGTGLLTESRTFKRENDTIDMGNQSRPETQYSIIVWDTKVDPAKTAAIEYHDSKETKVGEIIGGIPYFIKEIEIPSGIGGNPIDNISLPITNYFGGSNKFLLAIEDISYSNNWIVNDGSINFDTSNQNNIVITGTYPAISENLEATTFTLKVTSTEYLTFGQNAFVKVKIGKVTAAQDSLVSISATGGQSQYRVGDFFSKENISVTATYKNGTTKEIKNIWTYSPTGPLTFEDKKVIISYTEKGVTKTCDFPITVSSKIPAMLNNEGSITTGSEYYIVYNNKKYYKNDTNFFECYPGEIITCYTYGDGGVYINGIKSSSSSTYEWTIPVEAIEIRIEFVEEDSSSKIYINTATESQKILNSIEISEDPIKLEYEKGEKFDPAGMVVKAIYTDFSERELTNTEWEYSPAGPLSINDTVIIITYIEKGFKRTKTIDISIISHYNLNFIFSNESQGKITLKHFYNNSDILEAGAKANIEGPNDISLEYSLDNRNWYPVVIDEPISATKTNIYIRGDNPNGLSTSENDYYYFSGESSNTPFKIKGNLLSLLGEEDTIQEIPNDYCFYRLFSPGYDNYLQDASGLVLSVNVLKDYCYAEMFYGCRALKSAPKEIEATILANYCCKSMFEDCIKLTSVPSLPTNVMSEGCYESMFSGCTLLQQAPKLSSIYLAKYCYRGMFNECSNLDIAPALPATLLFEGCYKDMFSYCSALRQAPELPAGQLTASCYAGMFKGCSTLNYIKVSFSEWNEEQQATDSWVDGVAMSGTFECLGELDLNRGISFIPESWNIVQPETPLCFTAKADNSSITLNKYGNPSSINLQYSTDLNNWQTYTFGTKLPLENGDKIYLRNTRSGTSFSSGTNDNYYRFSMTGKIAASGNIMSLIDNTLKATTVSDYCFSRLFENCSSLITPPKLPATTLNYSCYYFMFRNCTNLIKVPDLPALILQGSCYFYMFYGCSSIKLSTDLSDEYKTSFRIPTTGNGSMAQGSGHLTNMFSGTGGTFTGMPAINKTYYGAW